MNDNTPDNATSRYFTREETHEDLYVNTLAQKIAAMNADFCNCEVLLSPSGGGRYVRERDGSFKKGNVVEFWFKNNRGLVVHEKVTERVSLAVFAAAMEAVGVKFNDSP